MERRSIRKRPRVDSGGSGSSDGAVPAPPSPTMNSRRSSSDDGGVGQSGEASMDDMYSMMQLFGGEVRAHFGAAGRARARARSRQGRETTMTLLRQRADAAVSAREDERGGAALLRPFLAASDGGHPS